jgi:hypothetical protein
MDAEPTVAVLLAAAAVFGWANWRQRRGHPPGEPSLVPYTLIQMVAVVAFMVMAAHMISLLTGTPFRGRMGY